MACTNGGYYNKEMAENIIKTVNERKARQKEIENLQKINSEKMKDIPYATNRCR